MGLLMKNTKKIRALGTALVLAGLVASVGHAQDAEHGKSVFKACAVCHSTDKTNRVGPGLEGIVGRAAGTVPGFRYSKAMKDAGMVWDATSLDGFLELPQKAVPGNRMPYAGLKGAADRADVIAYLSTLK
jgi:cytochrome c